MNVGAPEGAIFIRGCRRSYKKLLSQASCYNRLLTFMMP